MAEGWSDRSGQLSAIVWRYRLDGDHDVDLVADHQLVALERDVEVDAPLLARQGRGALEADAAVAPRVDADAEVVELEVDRLAGVFDREGGGR